MHPGHPHASRPAHADAPMPQRGDLIVQGRLIAPARALQFSFVASSGPGGQNVNKRATKCVLRVSMHDLQLTPAQQARLASLASHYLTDASELIIDADEFRSQERNREGAMERLGDLVRRALIAPKARKATKPTRGSKERRLQSKRERSEVKRMRRDRAD